MSRAINKKQKEIKKKSARSDLSDTPNMQGSAPGTTTARSEDLVALGGRSSRSSIQGKLGRGKRSLSRSGNEREASSSPLIYRGEKLGLGFYQALMIQTTLI